jgi:hypothetical protein
VYLTVDTIWFAASYNSGASWSAQHQLFAILLSPTSIYAGREPWIAAYGDNVYVTWEANSTTPGVGYHDQAITSTDGGQTWGAVQNLSDSYTNSWEPENAAYGNNVFEVFHAISDQGIYVMSATNVNSESPRWSGPTLLSPTKLHSSFAHVFTSDGVNVFVLWGQQISKGSSVWNAYIAYSGDSGTSWSTPIDISNNANGVAAGNTDVTSYNLSTSGTNCYAIWTYTNAGTSQIYFAGS